MSCLCRLSLLLCVIFGLVLVRVCGEGGGRGFVFRTIHLFLVFGTTAHLREKIKVSFFRLVFRRLVLFIKELQMFS